MKAAKLLSIQIASAAEIPATGIAAWWDKPWTSGFHKQAVAGRIWLGYEGLRGDQQADRENHGGVDKAVCVYAAEHYPSWRDVLKLPEMAHGAFGENFTVQGLMESEICIGDVFQVGAARVQVSQPRQPCWKLARRWRIKDLSAQVEQNGRTGFYFRVLQHGWVEAGDTIELVDRSFPRFAVAYANQIMHRRKNDIAAAMELASCPLLSGSWKDSLWLRAENNETTDGSA
ncbi:MOSC domain-containing protein [bacterium]|nr:MOSC domain-containing protein [bacterium]